MHTVDHIHILILLTLENIHSAVPLNNLFNLLNEFDTSFGVEWDCLEALIRQTSWEHWLLISYDCC